MTIGDVHLSGGGDWPVARMTGEVDLSNVEALGAVLEDAVSNRAQGLVLDLSGLTFLDSMGLRLIYRLARQLGDRQQRLQLVVPESSPVTRVLQIGGVMSVAEVVPSDGHQSGTEQEEAR